MYPAPELLHCAWQTQDPAEDVSPLPRVAQIAIQHALGRDGVAVVALPGDIADEEATSHHFDGLTTTHRACAAAITMRTIEAR